MRKTIALTVLLFFLAFPILRVSHAKPNRNATIGVFALGNIQLLNTIPEFSPGPGGGAFFDYRFNQRFSVTVDAWASVHDGSGPSTGDNNFVLMGIPTFTIKMYLLDSETSRFDPYAGLGIGAYAMTEGSVANGTNGLGLGAQIDVGFDYHLSELFSVGFSGVFRSAGVITSLSNTNNNANAVIPYSLIARLGFHL